MFGGSLRRRSWRIELFVKNPWQNHKWWAGCISRQPRTTFTKLSPLVTLNCFRLCSFPATACFGISYTSTTLSLSRIMTTRRLASAGIENSSLIIRTVFFGVDSFNTITSGRFWEISSRNVRSSVYFADDTWKSAPSLSRFATPSSKIEFPKMRTRCWVWHGKFTYTTKLVVETVGFLIVVEASKKLRVKWKTI